MGEYLLIGINDEKFAPGGVDPDRFEEMVKKVIGPNATLEDISAVGPGPAGKPSEEYAYFVKTEEQGLRPKLIGVPGVGTVLFFATRPHTG